MKIKQILREYFPEIKERKPRRKVPDIYDYNNQFVPSKYPRKEDNSLDKEGNKTKKLGTGAFSTAYTHKDNPHDVTKGSRPVENTDGYEAFFRALSKSKKAKSNIYFPRFRNINTFTNKETGSRKRTSYMVKTERLHPLSSLSYTEANALLHKMFTKEGRDWIADGHENPGIQYLVRGIDGALDGYIKRDQIKDEELKYAVRFLDVVRTKSDFQSDMHEGNLMVRRTSVGPQIVINDPFGFSSSGRD